MTDASAVARPSRLRMDKWAFFVALLIGVVAIIALDMGNRTKLIAVVFCVLLQIAYAAGVLSLPALKLRTDQAADNSYYLGLLFTLTSLGVALFRFANVELASESILRNFGIAIFTTIAGLGLRVGIAQFREDPDDLEHEAREALSETVRRLRGELDQAVAELQRFADGARQALQESSDAAKTSTADALTAAVARFETALLETAGSFNKNTEGFNARANTINASLDNVAEAVGALTGRISAVRADASVFEDGLRPVFATLEGAVSNFSGILDGQREKIELSLGALAKFADTLGRFQDSTGSLAQASTDLQTSIAAIREGPAVFERLSAATQTSADAAESLSSSLDNASARAGATAEESIRRLTDATVALAERTNTTLQAVEEASARAVDTMTRLNTEFAGSGDTVEHVRRELAELAGWIVERLDRK
jgi:phage shock protein A